MSNWFTVGDEKGFNCCNCNEFIVLSGGGLDHHPSCCPECGVACLILEWNKWLQVVVKDAPLQFQSFVCWAQKELDELEFIELLSNLEEIAEKIYEH